MPVPIGVAAAYAGFSGFSAYRQTQLTNAQKRQQARIAELNADTAELEGDLALKASFKIESESRRQTKQLIGTQRAAMAATGFAVGEGSFADIIEMSVVLGEVDAMNILYEGELAKFRKEKEAASLRAQAENLRESQQDPFLAGLGGAAQAVPLFF